MTFGRSHAISPSSPRSASGDVALRRRLVDTPLAAGLPIEVLDRTGELVIVGGEACLGKQLARQAPGRRPTKGLPIRSVHFSNPRTGISQFREGIWRSIGFPFGGLRLVFTINQIVT